MHAAGPGFYAIPGALSEQQQQQLAAAALQEYPEPPSRSNHSSAHGPLPRLWKASQLDLRLARAGTGPCCCRSEQQGCAPSLSGADLWSSEGNPVQREDPDRCRHHGLGSGEQRRCNGQPWSAEGPGPAARHLLNTLRWVTLGPPYCWTARTYDRRAPHTPLPALLVQLAQRFAAVAAELDGMSAASTSAGQCSTSEHQLQSSESGGMRSSMQPHACNDSARAAGADGHCLGAAEAAPEQCMACGVQKDRSAQDKADQGLSAPFSSHQGRVWEPDVALVNYYREGDTLGGHQDDVERDKEAPIVAISLGCTAIFLLGGEAAAFCVAHHLCSQSPPSCTSLCMPILEH